MTFWAYLLHCRGGTFYAGHTDDLDRRIGEHVSGLTKGYTHTRLPVELVWSQEFPTRYEALAAERQIKGWSRAKKLALIRGDWAAISGLARKKDSPSTSSGRTVLGVDAVVVAVLLEEAQRAYPLECCGLLLGQGERVAQALPAANVHPRPDRHFEIDPAVLIGAHRAARAGGPQVLGYYHSHPNQRAEPSAEDRAQASGDGRIWAIVATGSVTWWRDGKDCFEPLPSRLIEG